MKNSFKRIISTFLAVLLIVGLVPLSGLNITASAEEYSGTCGENLTWTFDDETGELIISGEGEMDDYFYFKNLDFDVKSVFIEDGVTSIGAATFSFCKSLESISIADSVLSINYCAFEGCNNLKSVTIPDSVADIESHAFSGCSSLTEVVIGNGVVSIDREAFFSCESLKKITIPYSVTSLGDNVFWACYNLESIIVSELNMTYSSDEYGVLFNKDKTKVIKFPEGSKKTSYIIPDSVEIVDNYAFTDCYLLENITIPQGVTSIGDFAFYWCGSLKNIEIPDSVTSIGDHAFTSCDSLTDITIPNSVTRIEEQTFRNCSSLESIEIPNSVTFIDDYALDSCIKLKDIYYSGTQEEWNNIVIENNDGSLLKAIVHFNSNRDHIPSYTATVITEPTCMAEGVIMYTCVCGATYTETVQKIGHSYEVSVSKAPTCTEDGIKTYACECGDTYTESIPGNGHCYTSKVTIQPTYTTEGERTYTCEKCGDTYTEVIPKLQDHAGAAVFCLNIVEETANEVKLEVYLEPRGCVVSNFDLGVFEQNDKISDCTELEINDKYFLMAGNNDTRLIAGAEADGVNVPHRLALYTFTKRVNENVDIDDFELVVTNFGSYCCGEYTVNKNLPENTEPSEPEHNFNHIVVPSTCTVAGMEYDICSDCGEVINSKVLPLASHTLSHVVVESTCTVEGMEYDICSVCGGTFNTAVLTLKPHSWSEWKIVREATAALEGIKERSCTVCGTTEEELIPKLNVIVDDESGISIEFNDEYDPGVEIKVQEVFDGDSFQILDLYHGNNQSVIFDITTEKDGEKVQPNGKVKVRVPIPEGFDTKNLFVCYVDSTNGTVTNIPAMIVDGYIEFFAEHFSYYAIVEKLGKVKSVSIDDISMSYKDSATITPNINVDAGVDYTVTYSSSNTDVVSVDANGKVTTNGTGSETITVTVTDEYGNTVTDTCNVNVSYKWWQWIIVIVLFGWIWY